MGERRPRVVLVVGSGRSGTSWLGQMVQAAGPYISVFEPLHPSHVPEAVPLWGRYLRPDGSYPPCERFFDRLVSGGGLTRWSDQENPGAGSRFHPAPWMRRVLRPPRVIKMIRANLMLGWLRRRYPIPAVYVVRHPAAAIASWLKLGWGGRLDRLSAQADLIADHLAGRHVRWKVADPVEALATRWAIENLVPISQMRGEGWTVATYEELLADPCGEVTRVLGELGLPFTPQVAAAIDRPSISTHDHSTSGPAARRLSRWQTELSRGQIDTILRVVHAFEFGLYGEEPMPLGSLRRWAREGEW
jgi:hypothetical protein